MKELSVRLAEYARSIQYDSLPEFVRREAKLIFKDSIGCMVGGLSEPLMKKLTEYEKAYGKQGSLPLITDPEITVDAADAAFVMGCAINVHDMDDVTLAMNGHPSAVVLPAALTIGCQVGASGKEILEAYVCGIEIACLLGKGLCPESFKKGWHCTATIGIFGAAAAAGKLLALSETQMAQALAMAASEASGIKGNLGSEMKVLHAGRAAQKGILAARLAGAGFEGNSNALEGPGGFGPVTVDHFRIEDINKALENKVSAFIEPGIGLKAYPSCKCSFNGIDALKKIMSEEKISWEEIQTVRCYMQSIGAENMKYRIPETKLQGKLSMPYCLALAAVEGNVSLASFEGDEPDPKLKAFMERVEVIVDEALEEGYPEDTTQVELVLQDGRTYEETVLYPKGDPGNRLTQAEIEEKFCGCCALTINKKEIEEINDLIGCFEGAEDAMALVRKISEIRKSRK